MDVMIQFKMIQKYSTRRGAGREVSIGGGLVETTWQFPNIPVFKTYKQMVVLTTLSGFVMSTKQHG